MFLIMLSQSLSEIIVNKVIVLTTKKIKEIQCLLNLHYYI